MNKKIIITGSLAFDTIMNFKGRFADNILPDKIHSLNLSFLVDEMQKTRGGTAGNIAYNLGLLGCKPVLLSTFGKDGEEYRNFLRASSVDISVAPISKKLYTSQSLVLTDAADNQITSFYAGAMEENEKLTIASLLHLPRRVKAGCFIAKKKTGRGNGNEARYVKQLQPFFSAMEQSNNETMVVISPNTPNAMRNFTRECINLHVSYMYDPGMQLPRISDEDLKKGIENCEILIGNDYEIELMKKRIGDLKPPILVVTLGEKGAVIFENGKQHVINPTKPKSVIDPTGAGDAFRAGFLAGYVRGLDLKTCGQMGATAAVYTVEKYGTTTHEFTLQEFCERYKENYKENLLL